MRRLSSIVALTLCMVAGVFSQTANLTIQHPQQTWRQGKGTIKNPVSSIRPQGAYTRNDLYLTLSADGLGFSSTDSVEIILQFTLPATAIVNDLWLWVDNVIMQALIMDRWTASAIYENIVKRRRDPALLVKNSATSYELRVYPLSGTGSRRIRLSYLTLNDWSSRSASHILPLYVLNTSRTPVPKFSVLFWESAAWKEPRLVENASVRIDKKVDSLTGQPFSELTIPSVSSYSSMTLAFKSVITEQMFVRRYQKGEEGVYEVGFLPSQILNVAAARKIAVLFDFNPTKSSYTNSQVLQAVKNALMENLTSRDSINLIFSQVTILRAGEKWFGGDSTGIAEAFKAAGDNPISNYSNLPSLISNGIDFIKTRGGKGMLWLVANTDGYGSFETANPLLNDLLKLMPQPYRVHVSDFCSANISYYYFNNQTYLGNQYLYENFSRLTKGSYQRIVTSTGLPKLLQTSLDETVGRFESVDVSTRLAVGYSYGRFYSKVLPLQALAVTTPVFQIGRFTGQFPITIDIAGRFQDSTVAKSFVVSANSAFPADSVADQIWTGYALNALEAESPTSQITSQIVTLSVAKRVLSRFTAFLALEPGDSVKPCMTCRDETILTPVVNPMPREFALDSLLFAYPNPFNASTTLRVRLPANAQLDGITLAIHNVLGQEIRRLDVRGLQKGTESSIVWDGRNDEGVVVGTGMYVAVLRGPSLRASVKLLLVK